jgi:type II pantothenate kinase
MDPVTLTVATALPEGTAGVDAGATLCKLVYQGSELQFDRRSSSDLAGIEDWLRRHRPRRIGVTGGGAPGLMPLLGQLGTAATAVPEFAAWALGAPQVAQLSGLSLPERSVLVSLGTGTSILGLHRQESRRLGGCALGGGTIVGLGRLLTGESDFHRLTALAAAGDRRAVDLLVGDIYPQGGLELAGHLNAASFGKLGSRRPEDLMAAVMALVGENVALLAAALGRDAELDPIVYCGSSLEGNAALEAVLAEATRLLSRTPSFLPRGAYCGALGAAVAAAQPPGT